ncbi:MAG: hypothetical protein ACFFDT_34580 [Candidatus Hodarchaeota archaeon]
MSGLEQWIKKERKREVSSKKTSPRAPSFEPDKQYQVEDMLSDTIEANPLWKVLIETVEKDNLYSNRLAYVRENIILTQPDITPEELSERIGIPLGISMVILYRLQEEK